MEHDPIGSLNSGVFLYFYSGTLIYATEEYSVLGKMKKSKLFNIAVVVALLFANMACACTPSDTNSEPAVHHHTTNQDDAENTPCSPQNCDGCDDMFARCTTGDSSFASVDREAWTLLPKKIELDGPDLGQAILDTGQTRVALSTHIGSQSSSPPAPRVLDTPIRRKDQLTE